MRILVITKYVCLALLMACTACGQQPQHYLDLNKNGVMDLYENPAETPEKRSADLISRLTLAEKTGLMGSNATAVPRLGIPAFGWDNEGKHAIVTCFPTSIGMAASWDPVSLGEMGSALGDEARVMSLKETDAGRQLKWLSFWAPTINMARDPRWGRTMETYSEDPYLTSQLAISFVKGMQGNDPRYLKAVAGVNHFAGYSRELGRHELNADIPDEKQLREYYLEGFRQCVTKAGNAGIGAANNALNGVPSCGNSWLLTNVLREEWGFRGYVFSDAGSVSDIAGIRKYLPTHAQAVALTVKAGCDIDCGNTYQDYLGKAISENYLRTTELDASLMHSLSVRFRLGLFDPKPLNPYNNIPDSVLDGASHRRLALDAARASIVLLKNKNNMLPLSNSIKHIVIAGPRADQPELGRKQSGHSTKNISALQGIRSHFPQAEVLYSKDIRTSVQQARGADVIIYCTSLMEGEVSDRLDLHLSPRQEADILQLSATGKPVIVVLYSGGSVDVSPWIDRVSGLVEAWYPGEEGGNALADVLAGIVNPSGKLPVTFYRNVNDLPPFGDFDIRKGRTYMYTHTQPQYPFGFGLSYTSFNTRPELVQRVPEGIQLSAKVRNTGTRDGAEIVQLYVSYAGDGSRSFPTKRLKAFKKVFLKQGEERQVEFTLKDEDLAFYDNAMNLKLFAGDYTFFWANSSADNRKPVKLTISKARILKTGPLLSYGPLKIINQNLQAGDSLRVDVICRNRGDITGRAEIAVDGKSYTQTDTYVGPRLEAVLHFRIPLAGAVPHVLQVHGQPPTTVVPVAGKKELLISQSADRELATVGQRISLNYQLSNNTSHRKSFISNLTVNGKISVTRTIDLAPGKAQAVAFSVSFNKPGIYSIALNGECRSVILVGARISQPFKVFKSDKGAFYQVDSTTFWGYASGSVGGTPVSNNYGERTANDRYGALYVKGGMAENSVVTVRIHQQERTGNYAKVGLMIRNRIDQPGRSAGYSIACVSSYYGGGGLFEWDSAQAGFLDSLHKINLGPFPDKWLRIERHGSQYTVWASRDGSQWKRDGQFTIAGAAKIQDAGVFVTSDDPTRVCQVVFSDFAVMPLAKPMQETDRSKRRPHERIFTAEPI